MPVNINHKHQFEVKKPEDLCCDYCAFADLTLDSDAEIACTLNPMRVHRSRSHHCGYGLWYFGGDLDRYLAPQAVMDDWEGEVSSYFAQDHSKPEPPEADEPIPMSYGGLYQLLLKRHEETLKLLKDLQLKWLPGPTHKELQEIIDTLGGEEDA